ncbi:MAG TPA: hypothetical protein VGQ63_13425 [Pseudolabrys sp.]|nr:hypothetical protein [Pseudolabrys sp.]
MATDQTTQALCHTCRTAMVYVTAMPHPTVRHMRKTTFVCYTCHQTRSYMLSSLMADAYAAVSGRDAKVIAENAPDQQLPLPVKPA